MVVVAALAYATQAPSLGVAEFTPTAQRGIDAPPTTGGPDDQSEGPGGRRPRSTTTSSTTLAATGDSGSAAPTTRVGRARPCYGNPPRALPDPRSPACIPMIYEGDNGGRTARGVTDTEIRVAWPFNTGYNGYYGDQWKPTVQAMFDYVNRHFELYGRKLVPVMAEHGFLNDVPQHRSFAAELAALDVFAALDEPVGNSVLPVFLQEVARQKIVTVGWGAWEGGISEREMMDPAHPYLWSVYPSWEQTAAAVADLVCRSLAERPASHAGGDAQGTTRKFGIVVAGRYRLPSSRTLREALEVCDVQPEVVEAIDDGNGWSDDIRNGAEKLRSAGVTTLLCACTDHTGPTVISTLKGVWEDPEWILPLLSMSSYEEGHVLGFSAAQRSRLFGVQPHAKAMPIQSQRWYGAVSEVDVTMLQPQSYWMAPIYEELLLLAAGIQAAGPNLTADSFAQGLMTPGLFANTDAGQAPDWLPSVGFGPGDHSFYDDFALAWWSDSAPSSGWDATVLTGSWCYLDRGARYRTGSFPADADSRFFTEAPCR